MKVAAAIAYTIGLVAELFGASRVVIEARRAQRSDPDNLPPVQRHLRSREPVAIRADFEAHRRGSIPSTTALALLFGGIIAGYLGCFLSLG